MLHITIAGKFQPEAFDSLFIEILSHFKIVFFARETENKMQQNTIEVTRIYAIAYYTIRFLATIVI